MHPRLRCLKSKRSAADTSMPLPPAWAPSQTTSLQPFAPGQFSPGVRVPSAVISPWLTRGYVRRNLGAWASPSVKLQNGVLGRSPRLHTACTDLARRELVASWRRASPRLGFSVAAGPGPVEPGITRKFPAPLQASGGISLRVAAIEHPPTPPIPGPNRLQIERGGGRGGGGRCVGERDVQSRSYSGMDRDSDHPSPLRSILLSDMDLNHLCRRVPSWRAARRAGGGLRRTSGRRRRRSRERRSIRDRPRRPRRRPAPPAPQPGRGARRPEQPRRGHPDHEDGGQAGDDSLDRDVLPQISELLLQLLQLAFHFLHLAAHAARTAHDHVAVLVPVERREALPAAQAGVGIHMRGRDRTPADRAIQHDQGFGPPRFIEPTRSSAPGWCSLSPFFRVPDRRFQVSLQFRPAGRHPCVQVAGDRICVAQILRREILAGMRASFMPNRRLRTGMVEHSPEAAGQSGGGGMVRCGAPGGGPCLPGGPTQAA